VADNIDVVRRLEEAYGSGDLDALDELIADDFVAHTAGSDQIPPGREGIKMAHGMAVQSFPDRKVTIEDIFAEGDMVTVRCRMRGTNKGGVQFAGVPANDKQDGKLVESWAQMDVAKMMQQLGVMPGPEGE
jgi:predicted ester cyclase